MARRQVNVILLSEARKALLSHYVAQVTPQMIEGAILSGTALGPCLDELEKGEIVDRYRQHLAAGVLGTSHMVLIQDDARPERAWVVATKPNASASIFSSIVKKGIALLNENGPSDWQSKIDLSKLDMTWGDACVLGQIYTDSDCHTGYSAGLQALWPDLKGDDVSRTAAEHGFDFDDEYNLVELNRDLADEDEDDLNMGYRLLTAEWKRQLSAK